MITAAKITRAQLVIKCLVLLAMIGALWHAIWKVDWPQAIFWLLAIEVYSRSEPRL